MPSLGFVTAYLLHSRSFQDDRLLLDLLVQGQGRQRAVARRPGKKQHGRARWPEFTPLTLQLVGQGELKQVRAIEETQLALPLLGTYLFAAMYINELICRVFPTESHSESLFDSYQQCLAQLGAAQLANAGIEQLEWVLRQFEFALLRDLGLPIDVMHDREGQPIIAEQHYQYDQGFVISQQGWRGRDVLDLLQTPWHEHSRRLAKQLCRQLLAPWLGSKPLQSRQLFLATSLNSAASPAVEQKETS